MSLLVIPQPFSLGTLLKVMRVMGATRLASLASLNPSAKRLAENTPCHLVKKLPREPYGNKKIQIWQFQSFSTWWQLKDFWIFTPTICDLIWFDGPASFSRGLKLETTNLLLLTNLRICQTVSKIVRPAESHWKTAKQTHLRFMSWATISLLRTLDLFSWTVRG